MGELDRQDVIETLVVRHLKAEADKVDGAALLERVRHTRRMRRLRTPIVGALATAAVVALSVAGILMLVPSDKAAGPSGPMVSNGTPDSDFAMSVAPLQGAAEGARTAYAAAEASVENAMNNVYLAFPETRPLPGAAAVAYEAAADLRADAAHIGNNIRTLFAGSLRKTGLEP